jgi:hypothetical protein
MVSLFVWDEVASWKASKKNVFENSQVYDTSMYFSLITCYICPDFCSVAFKMWGWIKNGEICVWGVFCLVAEKFCLCLIWCRVPLVAGSAKESLRFCEMTLLQGKQVKKRILEVHKYMILGVFQYNPLLRAFPTSSPNFNQILA